MVLSGVKLSFICTEDSISKDAFEYSGEFLKDWYVMLGNSFAKLKVAEYLADKSSGEDSISPLKLFTKMKNLSQPDDLQKLQDI